MSRPRLRLPRPGRPRVDRSLLRDPRLLLALVPVVALLVLMMSGHSARTESELAAAASTTTTTAPAAPGGAGPDVAVAGTEITAPGFDDGAAAGAGSGSGGSAGGTTRGSTTRRSSGSGTGPGAAGSPVAAVVAGIAQTPTTTTPAEALPPAAVSEAASPAVMGLVGVGVSVLAINGVLLVRRRRAGADGDDPEAGNRPTGTSHGARP